ncbi:MAG TPA: hypothetical protein VJV03_07655 [Pyrinomonadaceae bacterium]|nr:hypothetical protein [Pyrinomonadaceae bacterium]
MKSRILIFAVLVSVAFVGFIVSAVLWQRQPPNAASDPSATLPFRPAVTYDSWNVSIRNTEQAPYLNTSLRLYVGGTLYSMPVGTIRPGETVTHSLLSLTNEHGDKFNPNSVPSNANSIGGIQTPAQISELEVRATFRGHEAHKDFPPPK